MLQELKDVEKVKKTMHEQNGNINRETKKQKEILELQSTMTNMKMTRGIQTQIWTGQTKNQ